MLLGCATRDEVHPLQSALQAFQKIGGLNSIVVYPDLGARLTDGLSNGALSPAP